MISGPLRRCGQFLDPKLQIKTIFESDSKKEILNK